MRLMRLAAWSLLLSIGLAAPGLVSGAWAQELPRAKVIGVLVTAEWCVPCKEMEATGDHLMDRFDGEPILGIVLDVTNLSTRYHARLLAGTLGLDALYKQRSDSLGKIFLVDGESKEPIDTLTGDDDFETMSDKIRNALANR